MHEHESTTDATPPAAPARLRFARTRIGRSLLSLVAVGAIAGAGVLTTQATFTDQVTMATVTVQGGSLDLQAGTPAADGPNVPWVGTLSATVTNIKPGDENSGTVIIRNSGTIDFTITATTAGTDTNSCYSYYFRETAATGATKASAWPVNITNFGTAAGADGTTVALGTAVTNQPLVDNGADAIWETDDVKTYTLTVRMKQACATNAANGTLDFTLNATQA